MKLESVFTGLNISAAGLSAQRKKMNTIASNLANAETSKTEQGTPYRRKVVSFKSRTARMFSTVMRQSGIRLSTTNGGHMGGEGLAETTGQTVPAGIDVTESEDPSPPRTAFDPGNPDADANGNPA